MGRSGSSFNRRKARYKEQPTVLILCEDSKSCLNYLKDAARHFRAYADVEIAHVNRTDPLGIVEVAIARKGKYDQIYCAIDRDIHQNFDAALALAGRHGSKLDVVVSHPCYEFWLMLHFNSNRKPYAAAGAKSAGDVLADDLRKQPGMANYAKGSDASVFEILKTLLPTAIRHSEQVLAASKKDLAVNPSTRLHVLIRKLDELGKVIRLS